MHKYAAILKKVFITLVGLTLVLALVLVFLRPNPAVAPDSTPIVPPTQLPLEQNTTRIFFAGDIMLSREVHNKMVNAQNFLLPFEKVSEIVRSADISFANLESPFSDEPNISEDRLVFRADPRAIEGLLLAGFDVLSTANNHSLDQGMYGLEYTYNWLKQHNILPSGSHPEEVLPEEAVIQKNDVLFAFLSYTYSGANTKKDSNPEIGDFNNLEKLKQDILTVRGHYADVVIVNMHAGTEYVREPTEEQMAFARAAIDAGADLVIGQHPHWIQTVEEYKDKWIFYSLGNFVFDQMWSQDTREGLGVMATYDGIELKKLELLPVVIDNYCCARWASEEEKMNILQKINLTTSVLMNNN